MDKPKEYLARFYRDRELVHAQRDTVETIAHLCKTFAGDGGKGVRAGAWAEILDGERVVAGMLPDGRIGWYDAPTSEIGNSQEFKNFCEAQDALRAAQRVSDLGEEEMGNLHWNVNPRYTPGSPAQVDRQTAERLVVAERAAYKEAFAAGGAEAARARDLDLGGIVEALMERADGRWDVVDQITGERSVRGKVKVEPKVSGEENIVVLRLPRESWALLKGFYEDILESNAQSSSFDRVLRERIKAALATVKEG